MNSNKNDAQNKLDNMTAQELQGTSVLDADVSRETTDNEYERYKNSKKKKDLDHIREKGSIQDDNPYDYNNPTLKALYSNFRANDLSRLESGFNALYLWCYDNYYSSGVPVKNKYKNIHAHPTSWFKNANHMWKHNKWSVIVKCLDVVPAMSKFKHKIKQGIGNAKKAVWRHLEHSGSKKKSAGLLVMLVSLTGLLVSAIFFVDTLTNDFYGKTPGLMLYIDGEYAGDVLSISDAEIAKNNAEKSISQSLGKTYNFDCTVSYKATTIEKGKHKNIASIERSFKENAHKDMLPGYGLYYYDTLVAVTSEKAYLQGSMDESLSLRLTEAQKQDGSIERMYFNNFVIREGSYPKQHFNTLSDIRHMFSLPEYGLDTQSSTTDDGLNSQYLNVSDKSSMLVTGSAGTSSDVGQTDDTGAGNRHITIETVATKTITVSEQIPYGVDYQYDDQMAENRIKLVSRGKNGSKSVLYLAEYIDGKEVSRRTLNETIISEPENEVIIKGTRPLTEEERRVSSTGTYIYPSSGPLSSGYSWRNWDSYNEFHKGVDIRCQNPGDLDIVASDGGTVIRAGDKGDGYGLCILIQHDDGTITRYAHCEQLLVQENQAVAQGQQIAIMGRTGQATGVHVHFEIIRDGTILNPMDYLQGR